MNRNLTKRLLIVALTIGGATGGALSLVGAPQALVTAPDGFACSGQIFQLAGSDGAVRLLQGTERPGSIAFSELGPAGFRYNASSLDPKNRYIFALKRSTDHLLRINNTGSVRALGAIRGLPHKPSHYIGGFDPMGNFYVAGDDTPLYKIDVRKRKVLSKVRLSSPLGNGGGDITYSAGYFWAATAHGKIERIDPSIGRVSTFSAPVPLSGGRGAGGAFTYGNSDLGFFGNGGTLYRIATENPDSARPAFTVLSSQKVTQAGPADATSCFMTAADLGVTKVDPAEFTAHGAVSYDIRVANNGPAPSSGWTVKDTLPKGLRNPSASTPGCTILNRQLSCTGGQLAVGDSATITVTGTAPLTRSARFRPEGIKLDNTVTVWGNDPDPMPGNDTTAATTRVIAVPLINPSVGAATIAAASAIGLVRRRLGAGTTPR